MAPYPESEPVTLKRVEVALKKRDWLLLKEGITKIQFKFASSHQWECFDEWQNFLNTAYQVEMPVDLKENICSVVKEILESREIKAHQEMLIEQKELFCPENVNKKGKLAVIYNETPDSATAQELKWHRVILNNISIDNEKFAPHPGWVENISSLIKKLNNTNNEILEFVARTSGFLGEKSIISTSYSSTIIKNLVANKIKFSVNASADSINTWRILPLGGLTNQMTCVRCSSKMLDTSFTGMVAASCQQCSGTMYPDLTDISSSLVQADINTWYKAFNELVNSNVWVLINPPSEEEMPAFRSLITDAASHSKPERIYITSKRAGVGSWWKIILSEMLPCVEIKDHYTNVFMLTEEFKDRELTVPELCEA